MSPNKNRIALRRGAKGVSIEEISSEFRGSLSFITSRGRMFPFRKFDFTRLEPCFCLESEAIQKLRVSLSRGLVMQALIATKDMKGWKVLTELNIISNFYLGDLGNWVSAQAEARGDYIKRLSCPQVLSTLSWTWAVQAQTRQKIKWKTWKLKHEKR